MFDSSVLRLNNRTRPYIHMYGLGARRELRIAHVVACNCNCKRITINGSAWPRLVTDPWCNGSSLTPRYPHYGPGARVLQLAGRYDEYRAATGAVDATDVVLTQNGVRRPRARLLCEAACPQTVLRMNAWVAHARVALRRRRSQRRAAVRGRRAREVC